LESNIFCYRPPYSIQINSKLELKDTVNNTPSNLDRVGEPSSYNINGTTLCLSRVVDRNRIGRTTRHRHRISDTASAHRISKHTPSTHRMDRTTRHDTASTTESAVRHRSHQITVAVAVERDRSWLVPPWSERDHGWCRRGASEMHWLLSITFAAVDEMQSVP
jgi:hypothetical protein